jgi:N-acetylmuramoyl-L-alanine amidase
MNEPPPKSGRVFGQRDEDEKEPLGARSKKPPEAPKGIDPNEPYPWARPDDEKKPEPPSRDPDALDPAAPYAPTGSDRPKPGPLPRDPNAVDPAAPYSWTEQHLQKPPVDRSGASPTDPYPWGDEGLLPKPTRKPVPEEERIDPGTPYSWSEEYEPPAGAPPRPAGPPDDSAARFFRPPGPPPVSDIPARTPIPTDREEDPGNLSWDELLEDVDRDEDTPPVLRPVDPAAPPPETAAPIRGKRFGFEPDVAEEKTAEPLMSRLLKGTSNLLNRPMRKRRMAAHSYLDDEEEEADGGPREITLQYRLMARTALTIVGLSAVISTLLTWWTPGNFLPPGSAEQLVLAAATPATQVPDGPNPSNMIGIVSGHKGIHPATGLPDPGAVCEDTGLTEQQVNESIATRVVAQLQTLGYHVDLFDEFDPRLQGYHALLLLSIHADSCAFINEEATGFKVASFAASTNTAEEQRLTNCLIQRYATSTGLTLHPSVTFDMTDYHNFREIDARTPGAIIEIGFLYLDRGYLTSQPDSVAQGITSGITCYLNNELPVAPAITPTIEVVTPTP